MARNTIDHIKSRYLSFLQEQYDLRDADINACAITINTDTERNEFGDLNSNAPLVLAKRLGRKPLDLAQEIAEAFTHDSIARVETARPGFINIFLTQEAITAVGQHIIRERSQFFQTEHETASHYNLEYVSANPTGPLHFGHGRGGIIGDVLARILHFNSVPVTREYYVNDAGQQMHKLGMSLYYRCRQAAGDTITMPEDGYHGDYLVTMAQELVQQHGQSVVNNPYQFFADYACRHLRDAIKQTLAEYRVTFDRWFSEQTLHDENAVSEAIQLLTDKGYTYHEDGALWFTSTQFGDDKDRVLQRSDGNYTYVAADIAYLRNKFARGFDQLLMVLGQDHHSYVDRLKGAAEALGYSRDSLHIILYQMVSLQESGEQLRMSKRKGNIVSLDDIISMVGTDAARYFYLNKKADAHLEFDLELARTQSEENPVYYIQYAYVRTKSMLEKAAEHTELADITADDMQNVGDAERAILRKLASLKPLLSNIEQNYQTHLLAHYVYDVAHVFHSYYGSHKAIIPSDIEKSRMRLAVVQAVRTTLATGLELLGLSQPDKM